MQLRGVCDAGVVRAAQDVKIAQLQTAALDTLAVVLKATEGGHQLSAEKQTAIREQLNAMIADNRSSAVKAHATDVLALLTAGSGGDAEMHDALPQ